MELELLPIPASIKGIGTELGEKTVRLRRIWKRRVGAAPCTETGNAEDKIGAAAKGKSDGLAESKRKKGGCPNAGGMKKNKEQQCTGRLT